MFYTFFILFILFGQNVISTIRIRKDYEYDCNLNEPYYVPLKNCKFIIKSKKTINIYEEPLKNHVTMHPFSATCLKCATCLAVATQIHAIFSESVEGCIKKFQNEKIIMDKLNILCRSGYYNYDLRAYNSLYILTDNHKHTTHVNTEMNGRWPEKLREISCLFKNHLNVNSLYKHYLDGPFNMTDYLCRNGGVFRDCLNIKYKEVILPNEDQGVLTYIFNCLNKNG